MMSFLRKLFAKPKPTGKLVPESLSVVTVDTIRVTCQHPKEELQVVPWSELSQVTLLTNDQGPWFCDVYWHLVGDSSECFVPQGATGETELIEALQKLKDFDNEQFMAAMCCADNRQFICWERRQEEANNPSEGIGAGAPHPQR
jgi:hypothetical protein